MTIAVGLQSVGVSVPDRILDNDHWRRHHPQMISDVEGRIWMWRMRWGDVGLGALPEGTSLELLEAFEAEAGHSSAVAQVA